MSKLFEMLNGGTGDIPDLVRPVIGGAAESSPAGAEKNGDVPANAAATPVTTEAPVKAASPLAHVRVVRVRVPAPSPLLPFENGQSQPSEQYRILRTKIVQHFKKPRLIVISSAASGDGKSVSAINTAAAISLKSEGQVLLVDADFRRSSIHIQLGLPESPGLADVLRGSCTLEDAIVRTQEFPNLFVLSAGKPPENPVELLDSAAWQTLCNAFRSLFRFVILDSPPVGAVADYDLIQAVCDGVILVLRPDHTNRQLFQRSLDAIPKAKLLGVVMNCVPKPSLAKHGISDYYYYKSDGAAK